MAVGYIYTCELQTVKMRSNYLEKFKRSMADFMSFRVNCPVVDSTNRGPRSDRVRYNFALWRSAVERGPTVHKP